MLKAVGRTECYSLQNSSILGEMWNEIEASSFFKDSFILICKTDLKRKGKIKRDLPSTT